jgi:ATP-dependent Clp protease protease subunit
MKTVDFWTALLHSRQVLLLSNIDDSVAESVVAQLLFLQAEDDRKPIRLWINSSGGSISSALAIMDTMRDLRPQTSTCVPRQASGIAAMIAAEGAAGQRVAHRDARFDFAGTTAPTEVTPERQSTITADLARINTELARRLVEQTGQPLAETRAVVQHGRRFSAMEARHFGLVDEIVDVLESPRL